MDGSARGAREGRLSAPWQQRLSGEDLLTGWMPDVDGAWLDAIVSPDPSTRADLRDLSRPWSLESVDRAFSCLRTKPALHEVQREVDA
jgi:hypothetical protein